MKTLYRKGTVHPSPPPPPLQQPPFSDPLAFLPAAILALAAALTADDREVLAYLLSCSSANTNQKGPNNRGGADKSGGDHPPAFNCNCFRCYMSYWVRWDSSPNRQLIHEIIDAFEDSILDKNRGNRGGKRERRKKGVNGRVSPEIDRVSDVCTTQELADQGGELEGSVGNGDGNGEQAEKGPVKKLVGFIGERIWSVWG